jgi:hypothetical protein
MKTKIILACTALIAGHSFAQFSKFNKTWGPVAGLDEFNSVHMNSNGSFTLTGTTQTSATSGLPDVLYTNYDYWGNPSGYLSYGTTASDKGYSSTKVASGGVVVTGSTNISGNEDVLVLPIGTTVFTPRRIGGSAQDVGKCIIQTSDGGFMIAGFTYSYGVGGGDGYLIKLNSSGVISWTKTVGFSNAFETFEDIKQTSDGGYIAIGTRNFCFTGQNTEFMLTKLDASGNISWTKCIAAPYNQPFAGDNGLAVIQSSDGNYLVGGSMGNSGNADYKMALIKLNTSGNFIWGKTYAAGANPKDVLNDVQQTSDGGYILTGRTGFGPSNAVAIKVNATGTFTWGKNYRYSSIPGKSESMNMVLQHSDGGYIMAGNSIYLGVTSGYIVKTDPTGDSGCSDSIIIPAEVNITPYITGVTPQTFTGGITNEIIISTKPCNASDEFIYCQACAVDAGKDKINYYKECCTPTCTGVQIGVTPVAGYTYSWSPCYNLTSCSTSNPVASPCSTTTYTLTADGPGCEPNTDQVTVTTLEGLACVCGGHGAIYPQTDGDPTLTKIKIFPNPSSGLFSIIITGDIFEQLTITDNNGKILFQKTEIPNNRMEIDLSDQPKGIYFIKAIIDHQELTQKIIIE